MCTQRASSHLTPLLSVDNLTALQRQLETVFSSFSCLNASFLDEVSITIYVRSVLTITQATVNATSRKQHGLDLVSVREAYRLIFSNAPASIVRTIGNCTARLVTRMRQLHYDRPEMLRFILIIMEVRDIFF